MIKRATLSDLEPVAVLFDQYRQFYKQASDLTKAREFLSERLRNQDSVIFLALEETGRRTVGFTQLYPSFSSVSMKRLWILNDLYVEPDFRRHQYGRMLMQQCESFALADGARGLTLQTAIENETAQKLYQSMRWIRDEKFYTFYRRFDG